MYAAVRRFEGVRDSQKVVKVAKEGFVPIISEMPGFVAYYLVDAGDGVIVVISVFEHKDAEEESTFVAGEFVAEHEAPLLPNPPQITAGESTTRRSRRRDTQREFESYRCERAGASLDRLRPFFMPLFTQVRGIGILGSSLARSCVAPTLVA